MAELSSLKNIGKDIERKLELHLNHRKEIK